jgi:hypothetical protein
MNVPTADPLAIPRKGGWSELHRLTALGVNRQAARVLARLNQHCGDERGYWRHLRHGRPTCPACRAAHARAQARRRAALA